MKSEGLENSVSEFSVVTHKEYALSKYNISIYIYKNVLYTVKK